MTLTKIGGIAALTCAATYVVGFALLLTVLAPLGYGSADIDAAKVVAFIHAAPGVLIAWNSVIYLVNGLSLAVLVMALARWRSGDAAAVAQGIGLIWAALVIGAGMIANVAVERAASLYPADPAGAADLWATLHAVELGLGGGNEIAGGAWIALVSGTGLPRSIAALGLLTGVSGLATVVPMMGDTAGAAFGLGAIVWFLAVGLTLLRGGK
ncbi:hypothetical protein [Donghicola mangrovi]|uniref:DUF4386 family protein n=1 Tax=Donghicola mangrovi TaxID=2729614 RepID=A0A850Q704_9RHOB|nr:hypothetical protein [Donghicola mangrovi]NVO24733.1 hypothetical protein [Donghicola mangrovi]